MNSLEDLLNKSIPELSKLFVERRRRVPKGLLEALDSDPRQGAQQLAKRIRGRYRENRSEGQRLHFLLRFEIELWSQGYGFVAGVDEAGMAPLAGPVVAGAVILPQNYKLRGLNDSKKILDPEKRHELALQIKQDAICWSVGIAEVEEIDKINIYHAGLLAMQRAVEGLNCKPDFILVDARKIPHCDTPQRGIIRGDALSASIAAASIIAKTTRDAHMLELDQMYSGYGLASHKGYPTPEHCHALKSLGALPIHRRSFARVREALGLDPIQTDLFPAAPVEETLVVEETLEVTSSDGFITERVQTQAEV
ncbi:MAG TPA: ribonuclease HII [Pyrinomonadaceae bacterium]|nr:ribonuclease HII [Pyrinomonadaceae bacterium]